MIPFNAARYFMEIWLISTFQAVFLIIQRLPKYCTHFCDDWAELLCIDFDYVVAAVDFNPHGDGLQDRETK